MIGEEYGVDHFVVKGPEILAVIQDQIFSCLGT